MKIYFNRMLRRTAWGGGALFHANMVDHLIAKGDEIAQSLNDDGIDVIFMLDPRPETGGCSINDIIRYKQLYPSVRILHRINECDKRKGTHGVDELLMRSNLIADETVFISQWLKQYFQAIGYNKRSHVIMNGCNRNVFYNVKDKKLDPQKRLKIVTHHWSDNYNKGFDAYITLDEKSDPYSGLQFTYIGRYWNGYQPFYTKVIPPLYGKELGDELRKHDVYITASRFEPAGMHHIEGASCGLPVLYHSDGGGIVEVCKNHGIEFHDSDSLRDAIIKLHRSYSDLRDRIDYGYLGSERCCSAYYDLLRSML
jgi:hypothetical protein